MGFVAPADAYANAPVTTFSMMHTLSMRYFLEDGGASGRRRWPPSARWSRSRNAVDRCIGGGDRTSDHRYQDMRFLDGAPFFRALDVLGMKLNLFDPPLNLCDVHTSVNTLRVVLACLDGTGPEPLENRLFAVHYPYWPSGGHVREWRLK